MEIGGRAVGLVHIRFHDDQGARRGVFPEIVQMRDDELAAVDRGHGCRGGSRRRDVLAAHCSLRVEELIAHVQGTCDPRPPCDDDVASGQARHHRDLVQPGGGVGAKLGADPASVGAEALRADALVGPLVRPDDNEISILQARQSGPGQRLDRRRRDLDFRPGQRIGIEDAKLELGRRRRGAAGGLLVPGHNEARSILHGHGKLPPRSRQRRQVDQDLVAALGAART
ncbi:hypothetical protein JQ544_18740 [Bradyrhizobium diazoefficiens]|nr:hypothetical protein [Bradyrhizobium diazoefficiens]MBR0813577.1 hypothetical protein [Bradyrhizobium diazoefficiens]